jgi:hypothetical protein
MTVHRDHGVDTEVTEKADWTKPNLIFLCVLREASVPSVYGLGCGYAAPGPSAPSAANTRADEK